MKRSEFIGNKIKKPFPWAGSKVRVAPIIMDLLHGDGWANQHIEPFVGGNACLMNTPLDGVDVLLNDFDGKLTNLWRCLKYKPEELSASVTGVINTINLTAWDLAIQRGYDAMLDRLHADIDYCDIKLGAYYLDLMANWIGDNPGNCKGPWNTIKDEDGYDIMVRGDRGVGIRCKQSQYTANRGVACQQSQYTANRGASCAKSQEIHNEWFSAISNRLTNAKILSHDWKKILNLHNITTKRTAIMFDPPYNARGNNGAGVDYMGVNANYISDDVRNWIITNIDALQGTRIVVCGRGTEHDALLLHGFKKIEGKNTNSLNKKTFDVTTQEWLWFK